MKKDQTITAGEYLSCVYDLVNFVQTAKKLSTEQMFGLINELQILTINALKNADPLIIKNVGDANLIIFTSDGIDEKLIALLGLKKKLEEFLSAGGHGNKVSFSCHIGEAVAGTIGTAPFETTDVFGESINLTFLMNGRPFKGRFNISPQLFRKLAPATRKLFHKYTPQITYLAE